MCKQSVDNVHKSVYKLFLYVLLLFLLWITFLLFLSRIVRQTVIYVFFVNIVQVMRILTVSAQNNIPKNLKIIWKIALFQDIIYH